MAFKRITSLDGSDRPFEYILGTDAEAYTEGEALVLTSGRLTLAGATDTPEFICARTQAAEATAVTPLPVIRVTERDEFETTATATVAATLIGSKVTLHTDGLQVTATTTSGVFYLSYTDGVTDGGTVRGYFRR